MFMRRRPLLRAAVVGGGAYVAGKHMANKANEQASNEAYQNQRIDQLEQQQQPQSQDQQQYAPPPQQAPPPDAAPAAGPSMADQLQQIAALHQQGVLSDDEFAAAKAKLLGS
ncbi:MAG: SHOCT domain-containing protein [Streptosporangiaceae bacterium]